jgi:hypothetical protein
MKSVIYFQLIPNDTGVHSNKTGISVLHAHLSVFHEDIFAVPSFISICMKLFISLVKIHIFLIAFSHSFLSISSVELNCVGFTSSLS